jgi:hypothetical protein
MATSDDVIDNDALLRLALKQADRPRPDGSSMLSDFAIAAHCFQWLSVLANPKVFLGMSRMPSREHLLRIVDMYLAYVRRGERLPEPQFTPVPYEQREPLTLRLRALLETWSPPELSAEITDTARAVLHADGIKEPDEGWDNAYDSDIKMEDHLIWPENVSAWMETMQKRRKSDREGRF